MDPTREQEINLAGFRGLSNFIQQTYPPGRFLAISGVRLSLTRQVLWN